MRPGAAPGPLVTCYAWSLGFFCGLARTFSLSFLHMPMLLDCHSQGSSQLQLNHFCNVPSPTMDSAGPRWLLLQPFEFVFAHMPVRHRACRRCLVEKLGQQGCPALPRLATGGLCAKLSSLLRTSVIQHHCSYQTHSECLIIGSVISDSSCRFARLCIAFLVL